MSANYDIKRERRDLYAPRSDRFQLVDVPAMGFLMIDGHGDPNTTPAYAAAVESLFRVSYAVRTIARSSLGRTHTVGPLEGLWSAEDMDAFTSRDKSAWDWTLMIVQPDWISEEIIEEAKSLVPTGTPAVRFDHYHEGRSAMILHIGSYDAEAPTIARLHREFLPANGLIPSGRHHEVYLSDARRTAPAKLRTILRQPVAPRPLPEPTRI
jgi:hypothetical protein